jgi:hemolysin activation/secretion protein
LYAQISNTGTKETSEWRERIGFTHNQLTGNDDIFRLDYLTASFKDTNAILASYEAPISGDRLRAKIFGQASEFTAADVGALRQQFTGQTWQAGGELIYNVYQHREIFIDLIGGARWENVHVRNEIVPGFAIRGTENFFIPYVGARFNRDTGTSATAAAMTLEQSVSAISGSDNDSFNSQIKKLGRLNPNNDWTLLKFEGEQSFYLEPLFNSGGGNYNTLAHELAFSFRGQYAFGARLIPNESSTLGGLYTVRGYRESTVSGDSTIVGTAEYRFHLPRVLGIETDPKDTLFGQPFRWRPTGDFGRPDWDLILRAFFDAGATKVSDPQGREASESLMSTGLGVDFQIRNNISLRVDWGIPLSDVDSIDNPIKAGLEESRLHFVATFVY